MDRKSLISAQLVISCHLKSDTLKRNEKKIVLTSHAMETTLVRVLHIKWTTSFQCITISDPFDYNCTTGYFLSSEISIRDANLVGDLSYSQRWTPSCSCSTSANRDHFYIPAMDTLERKSTVMAHLLISCHQGSESTKKNPAA